MTEPERLCDLCFRHHEEREPCLFEAKDGKVVAPPDMPPQVKWIMDHFSELRERTGVFKRYLDEGSRDA